MPLTKTLANFLWPTKAAITVYNKVQSIIQTGEAISLFHEAFNNSRGHIFWREEKRILTLLYLHKYLWWLHLWEYSPTTVLQYRWVRGIDPLSLLHSSVVHPHYDISPRITTPRNCYRLSVRINSNCIPDKFSLLIVRTQDARSWVYSSRKGDLSMYTNQENK